MLGEVLEMREEVFLDNKFVLEICWKRKRIDEEGVEEDNDGFKILICLENRIFEVRECLLVLRKGENKYLMMYRGVIMLCCRWLGFLLGNVLFIMDL